MDDKALARSMPRRSKPRRLSLARPARALWQLIRKPLARSNIVKNVLASLLATLIRFIARTNPRVEGSHDLDKAIADHTPAIAAFWHGQHLLAPAVNPGGHRMVALFSKSADAELNALVAEKLGLGIVRGSGGRAGANNAGKGGARALIQLKRSLEKGCNVGMIADVPHGTPREAGLGIVVLARLSGRPVLPVAVATSRRKILERTWDKTAINLPFGRSAVVLGNPIHVPADADEMEMENMRRQVTRALNQATDEAYALVDGTSRQGGGA